jgi:hypothetical protein
MRRWLLTRKIRKRKLNIGNYSTTGEGDLQKQKRFPTQVQKNTGNSCGMALIPWGWLIFFLSLWEILLLAQNPGLMSDDSGEMAASAYGLGLPHPPAYPFFNLMGHLVCWLPVGTVAFRLNLFSEFLVLASLSIILITCQKIIFDLPAISLDKGLERLLLAAMGIVFVSCRSVFAQSLTAKGCIYTSTLFLTSLVVFFHLVGRDKKIKNYLFLTFFIWAVGMGNHWQTQILWIPFFLLWIYEKRMIFTGRAITFSVTTIVIGISIYLYLPLRGNLNCSPSWGYPINFDLFYWVISRQLVSGSELWIQNSLFYFESISEIFRVIFYYWLPGFALLALLGAWRLWLWKRNLAFSLLCLSTPIFLAVFAIHEQQNTYLMHIYLVPLAGLTVIFGFLGFCYLLVLVNKKESQKIIILFFIFISLGWLLHVFRMENRNDYLLAEDFGENVLKNIPKGAILLADGDHYVMPIWYEKFVNQKRLDLIFEPSVFLLHGWGWKQLVDQSEDLKPAISSSDLFQERLDALTKFPRSHPLYYSLSTKYLEPALSKTPGYWVPNGLTYAWDAQRPPSEKTTKRLFETMKGERLRGLGYGANHALDPSSADIYRYYHSQAFLTEKP